MKKDLLEILNNVLEDSNSECYIESLDPSLDLRNDLGFDSMDLALLTVLIEDEYGIDIFQDGLISNIGQIIEKINE